MRDINRVNLTGNLTREPEVKATSSGIKVLNFGIATTDSRFDKQKNEWVEYPNFINCTLFGARAESLARIMYKGQRVAIEGKLRYSQWEKDGHRRSKLEVMVDDVVLMSKPQYEVQQTDPAVSVYDDDCPF